MQMEPSRMAPGIYVSDHPTAKRGLPDSMMHHSPSRWNLRPHWAEAHPDPQTVRLQLLATSEGLEMEIADVVIVGGGIVGSSIAWHLTEQGCRNVLILERVTHQGKGSTAMSMGGVRAQFATAANIQMSMYSRSE